MVPKRVQLSRKGGWRMPPNTIKVDRSTKWGNRFKAGTEVTHPITCRQITVAGKDEAIKLFTLFLSTDVGTEFKVVARAELKGKNLACWCKAGEACHADILLAVANEEAATRRAA